MKVYKLEGKTRCAECGENAEIYLNELTTYPNFLVTFYRRDDHGETVNTSYEAGINRVNRSRDNYDAYIIAEAARLMREITDTVTYDGFVPDMARIVAHDTGDVYNLEF